MKEGNNGKAVSGDSRKEYGTKDFTFGQADVSRLKTASFKYAKLREFCVPSFFFFFFLPYPQHMELPGPGVEPVPQQRLEPLQ